jgi:hypothetical protein
MGDLGVPVATNPGEPMDIGAWLRELGLGQYEQAFRDWQDGAA